MDFSSLINRLGAFDCTLYVDAPMSDFVTFKTGGKCPLIIEPKNEAALVGCITEMRKADCKFLIIGNGSNLLVADKGIDFPVVRVAGGFDGLSIAGENRIECFAGCKLSKLCSYALENSLSGIEFAYGIPGTLGGAVFMNAGAYGGEMSDILESVKYISPDGEICVSPAEELGFSYRHSLFQTGDYVFISAVIRLANADKKDIKEKMDDYICRRKEKQPLEFPSAGSTFKRPEGFFAGALIEQCALKGKRIGGAMVSEKHAGFIINFDNATTGDILSLIKFVQDTVMAETGVKLETEVMYIG